MEIIEPKLSVVICTCNRAKYLEYALESLLVQTESQRNFEVLIIDNNSIDETENVFKKFRNKLPLRYFLEKKQGVSNARNRGVKEAKYDLIGFLDDDGKATESWVKLGIQLAIQEEAGIFGGPIYPYYESTKPKWFKDEYEIRGFGTKIRYLERGNNLSGSNMFLKKEIFKEIDCFDASYGMTGERIALGEESKLQIIADTKGIKRYYHPKLFVYHLVPEYKMKLSYFIKRSVVEKITHGRLLKEHEGVRLLGVPFIATLRSIRGFLRLIFIFFRNRKKYPYKENYLIEVVISDLVNLAKVKGLLT